MSSLDSDPESIRRRLRDALARGRAGVALDLLPDHCLPPERRPGNIIVERLMLAPEPPDGPEHAVPVVVVHREEDDHRGRLNQPPSASTSTRPLVAFLHGTGGDTEGLLDAHLIPLASRGYVAVGVDAPCHGRRLDPAGGFVPALAPLSDADVARRAGGHGHGARTRTRAETFARYGAALVAAWKGGGAVEGAEKGAEKGAEGGAEGAVGTTSGGGYSGAARPFLYDGAWDALRAVRLVRAREDLRVDPSRAAMSGISLGGMYSWLASAADPTVVTGGAAPLIGAQDFGWALDNDAWRARAASLPPELFEAAAKDMSDMSDKKNTSDTNTRISDLDVAREVYRRIVPGLCDDLDGPRTMPLVAPRPLLVVNGELDPRCPAGGLEGVVAAVGEAYERENARGRFRALAQVDTPHACTDEMIEVTNLWLDEILRPSDESAAEATFDQIATSPTWIRLSFE